MIETNNVFPVDLSPKKKISKLIIGGALFSSVVLGYLGYGYLFGSKPASYPADALAVVKSVKAIEPKVFEAGDVSVAQGASYPFGTLRTIPEQDLVLAEEGISQGTCSEINRLVRRVVGLNTSYQNEEVVATSFGGEACAKINGRFVYVKRFLGLNRPGTPVATDARPATGAVAATGGVNYPPMPSQPGGIDLSGLEGELSKQLAGMGGGLTINNPYIQVIAAPGEYAQGTIVISNNTEGAAAIIGIHGPSNAFGFSGSCVEAVQGQEQLAKGAYCELTISAPAPEQGGYRGVVSINTGAAVLQVVMDVYAGG